MQKILGIVGNDGAEYAPSWTVKRRLEDYATVGRQLFLQRIVIYSVAVLLTGAYYDWRIAAFYFAAVWVCEAYDGFVFRRILKRQIWRSKEIRGAMLQIYFGTLLSAVTISLFCISTATQQGSDSGHFLPLFLLVSASIFAAMNNHHFLPVLGLRLIIYVSTVLFIPLRDLWIESPPLSSENWLNFFTVFFVIGFILELSRSFLAGYSRYLSSRKELEEEHKLTKAAYETKTRFLATVSHELRTPLTSIRGTLEIINSGALGQMPEKMQHLVERAMQNSRRLGDLVGDLLFLQSTDIGKTIFEFEKLDMAHLVREAVGSFYPYAEKYGVKIQVDTKGDNFWIKGDKKRIDQVLMNLFSNAAKFSNNEGMINVSLEKLGNCVRISVKDEGIGIPEGSEARVFEEFSQLDAQDNRKFEGTGLGLNISKRIVEAHGGKIGYISQVGVGTTFFVDLKSEPAVV